MKKKYFTDLYWTPAGIFIVFHHLIMLVVMPFYLIHAAPAPNMIIAAILLLLLTELGIGMGYHRMYSHVAYRLKKPVEAIFLLFATMALQGPVLKWAFQHRLHHAHTDTERDPYSVAKGFWHAHVLWIFEHHEEIDNKVVPDLLRNKLVMFQKKYYYYLAFMSNTLISLFIGWLLKDYIGAFVLCFGVRLLFSYHLTWFINSLAHYWGERSYSKELSARDNAILAFLTVGEGYHNYHHTFPSDYRNGIRTFHFDPSKWIIWSLSKIGLAEKLRRFKNENIMQRLVKLDTELLKKKVSELSFNSHELKMILQKRALDSKQSLVGHIESFADSLKANHRELTQLIRDYRALRRRKIDKTTIQSIKATLKDRKRSYSAQWKIWSELCSSILRGKKLSA